jgi:hypothetical protein
MTFVVDGIGGGREVALHSGQPVTVGRETSQDIMINDRTLSRNHLVIHRRGEKVTIEILGLNGLMHNNAILKSQTIDLVVPTSFSVGNVPCRIKKKNDPDATILMAMPSPQSPSHHKSGLGTGSAAMPTGSQNHISHDRATGPAAIGSYAPPTAPPQNKEWPPTSKSTASDFERFTPSDFLDDDFGSGADDPFQPVVAPTSNIPKNLIIGITAGVLVIGAILFAVIAKPFKNEPTVVASLSPTPVITLPARSDTAIQPNDYYGKLYEQALKSFKDGREEQACDFLIELATLSEYQQKATDLASQLEDCNL